MISTQYSLFVIIVNCLQKCLIQKYIIGNQLSFNKNFDYNDFLEVC